MVWSLGLGFIIYNTLANCFNKHLNKIYKTFFSNVVKGLGFSIYGLGFKVQGLQFKVEFLWFRVYNTLVNYIDKNLSKSYKTLFRML